MTLDFENVWQVISNCVPPEITHFQKQSHPGIGWRLKTVIPSSTDQDLFKSWLLITQKHPYAACLHETAYDWNQNLIPNALSVWTQDGIDIVIDNQSTPVNYHIIPSETSFKSSGKKLIKQINKDQKTSPEKNSQQDWHNLLCVAQLISSWTTDQQARVNRTTIKVVSDDKNSGKTN